LQPNESLTLIEAVGVYVSGLKSKDQHSQTQQELFRFARWCGNDRALSDLGPQDVGNYGEQAVGSGNSGHAAEHLQNVRKFLSFAKKKGMTEQNLAQHLRIRKGKNRASANMLGGDREETELTHEGHSQMVSELENLKGRRAPIAVQIASAAADHDVRENVPLEAAREQLGLVESRIRQIEVILRRAVIVDGSKRGGKKVELGGRVRVRDVNSGRESMYTLVGATEARPLEGKISNVSPVGKALLRRTAGQEVEVETPRGKQRYRIMKVLS
jgi:transcription elongation factor GreA